MKPTVSAFLYLIFIIILFITYHTHNSEFESTVIGLLVIIGCQNFSSQTSNRD